MQAVIYNLDGGIREAFTGVYSTATFTYTIKTGIFKDLPILNRFAHLDTHSFNCDYSKAYPLDEAGLNRVAYYKYDGKDYRQLKLEEISYSVTPITITDYLTQLKLGIAKEESMIKKPEDSLIELVKAFTYVMAIILLIGVGYDLSQFQGIQNVNIATQNATLHSLNHLATLQQNQSNQLIRLMSIFDNKTAGGANLP